MTSIAQEYNQSQNFEVLGAELDVEQKFAAIVEQLEQPAVAELVAEETESFRKDPGYQDQGYRHG